MNPQLNPLLPAKPAHHLPEPAQPLVRGSTTAVDLIRQKVNRLLAVEPAVEAELQTAAQSPHPSKHQVFMQKLSHSGKSPAEVQTAWHAYYEALSDAEKHEVWQEFYSAQADHSSHAASAPKATDAAIKAKLAATKAATKAKTKASHTWQKLATSAQDRRRQRVRHTAADQPTASHNMAAVKKQLLDKVNARGKLKARHHVQSLLFGLGLGSVMLLFLLFGFFNERFIAPFITPSKSVSNTPIIVDPNQTTVDIVPKIIIPKINLEIPVIYDQPSIAEEAIQASLEDGVVHYATTPSPGQKGNAVLFGHSSNNILNHGKYKFAFVLLNRLEIGDTFMLTKDGKRYVYKVYNRKIVKPSEVGVLGPADKPSTATLITCDPPGTSVNRLVVIGEQISPDPNINVASNVKPAERQPQKVPSDAPTLWSRLTNWF